MGAAGRSSPQHDESCLTWPKGWQGKAATRRLSTTSTRHVPTPAEVGGRKRPYHPAEAYRYPSPSWSGCNLSTLFSVFGYRQPSMHIASTIGWVSAKEGLWSTQPTFIVRVRSAPSLSNFPLTKRTVFYHIVAPATATPKPICHRPRTGRDGRDRQLRARCQFL